MMQELFTAWIISDVNADDSAAELGMTLENHHLEGDWWFVESHADDKEPELVHHYDFRDRFQVVGRDHDVTEFSLMYAEEIIH